MHQAQAATTPSISIALLNSRKKSTLSSHRIGGRGKQKDSDLAPGPGAYTPSKPSNKSFNMGRSAFGTSFKKSKKMKGHSKSEFLSPGPGQY